MDVDARPPAVGVMPEYLPRYGNHSLPERCQGIDQLRFMVGIFIISFAGIQWDTRLILWQNPFRRLFCWDEPESITVVPHKGL